MKSSWKRIFSFITVFCMLVSLAPFTALAVDNTVTVEGTRYYTMAYEVLDMVNYERTSQGLNPLTMSAEWLEVAMLRSEELAVYYSHTRPDGTECSTAFPFAYACGENIAAGQCSPAEVMYSWMNSTGHRKNILDANYSSIGIGVFLHNDTLYWAQCFSGSDAEHAPAPADCSCSPVINLGSRSYPFAIIGKNTMTVGQEYLFCVQQSNPGFSYVTTYLKNDSVGWQSSDPAVATVDTDGTVTAISAGTTTISAYGGATLLTYTLTVNNPDHVHNMVHYPAIPPTYFSDGIIEYWHCKDCSKNFSDPNGKKEVSSFWVDKLICTDHQWDSGTVTKPSTTEEQGEITYTCTNCNETKLEPLEKLPIESEADYMDSGDLNRAKPTQQQLMKLWNSILDTRDFFVEEPSISKPVQKGKLEEDFLNSGLDYLNFMRISAGLAKVQLSDELNESAQYGATLLAVINELTHFPKYNGAVDREFYEAGAYATRTSNLSMRTATNDYNPLHDSVQGCMDDRVGTDNLTAVGHRRWLLTPTLLNVGFGYAQNPYYGVDYVTTPVIDSSGEPIDYNFIAWPASGEMLNKVFSSGTPWSITLNLDKYRSPSWETVSITVTRQSDGRSWVFDKNTPSTPSTAYPYMICADKTDTIIFNPGSTNIGREYNGSYTVTVKGIYTVDGEEAEINYRINFFSDLACDHSITEFVDEVAPTCTRKGYTAATRCTNCGIIVDGREPIDATGHINEDGNYRCDVCDLSICTKHIEEPFAGYAATCTEEGLSDGTRCTNCGDVISERFSIPALGHDYEEIVTIPNTCDEGGLLTFVCKHDASHQYTAETYPTGHRDFDSDYYCDTCNECLCYRHVPEVIRGYAPTCTKEGLSDGTRCSQCKVIITQQTAIPITSHVDEDGNAVCDVCSHSLCSTHRLVYTAEIPATCTEEGRSQSAVCEICGFVSLPETVLPPLGHTDTNYDIYCDRCGENLCEQHVPEKLVGYPATCTEDGLSDGSVCILCRNMVEEQKVIPATGHTDSNHDYVCDSCGTELCAQHNIKITKGTAPTCTKDGLSDGEACTICGKVLVEQTVLPATGHTPQSRPDREATCTTVGVVGNQYCSTCSVDLTQLVTTPALGHSFIGGICQRCGERENSVSPFIDVAETDFFYTPVLWAVENAITSGMNTYEFGPNNPCTRAQVVTFLWRAAGKPAVDANNPFIDVDEGAYYYEAVLWAVEQGITSGVSATEFAPEQNCTRGQIVTFLWRAAGKPTAVAYNPFLDIAASEFYHDAVLWAVDRGITKGLSDESFGPAETCTRGQIVTFLYRYYN